MHVPLGTDLFQQGGGLGQSVLPLTSIALRYESR